MRLSTTLGVGLFAALIALTGCKSGTKFDRKAPEVGTKMKEEQKLDMKMSMSMDMSAMGGKKETTDVSKSENATLTREVLAVTDGAPTKVKVTYASKSDVEVQGGQERKKDSLLVGKTFIAELKDGQIKVTDEQGAAVDEEAAMVVARDSNDLGKADQFVVTMPDRALKVGEAVPELASLIKSELTRGAGDKGPKPEIENVSVKLREDKNGVALFDVALTVAQAQGPVNMKMNLTGTLGVRKADSWPTELTLNGPVSIGAGNGGAGQLKLEGSGTMNLSRSLTYL